MSAERIINIFLDGSFGKKLSAEAEYEYKTAIADLLEQNYFHLCKNPGQTPVDRGPYNLHLSIKDGRLIMDIRLMKMLDNGDIVEKMREKIKIPMTPFRSVIKDYFFICESYFAARKSTSPSQLETIDMARRGLHNEGAAIMQEILSPNLEIDFETVRRLFTLLCVLHIR